jgi:uncharacterized membrane protein YqiK
MQEKILLLTVVLSGLFAGLLFFWIMVFIFKIQKGNTLIIYQLKANFF